MTKIYIFILQILLPSASIACHGGGSHNKYTGASSWYYGNPSSWYYGNSHDTLKFRCGGYTKDDFTKNIC